MEQLSLIVVIQGQEFMVPSWMGLDEPMRVLQNLIPLKYLYMKEQKELDTKAHYRLENDDDEYHAAEIRFALEKVYEEELASPMMDTTCPTEETEKEAQTDEIL